jgi:hypothetical protein
MSALLVRLPGPPRVPLDFTLDGRPCRGFEGDTVLTAVLALGSRVREQDAHAIDDSDGPCGPASAAASAPPSPRAGFCAMGACQDCWMRTDDGRRLRACTTPLARGMALRTAHAP